MSDLKSLGTLRYAERRLAEEIDAFRAGESFKHDFLFHLEGLRGILSRKIAEAERGEREALVEFSCWLAPGQAARQVGVSAQYMTSAARHKEIRAIKTPLGWLFDPEDVKRYASERKRKKRRAS